ncbi:hypothetical protein ACHAWU_005685 [Discostella pseudostelligera]|uniref:Uncharacterized protein n=1 Tax=Discostella pseudostelligera TaxID=259834 RepID=A0ABD3MQU3_9STRA
MMIATAEGASMSYQTNGQSPTPTSNTSSVNAFLCSGNKRLASCREELEQSWQDVGCGSGSVGVGSGGNVAPMSKTTLRCISYDGPFEHNDDEDEDMMMCGGGADNSSRVKRRKTLPLDVVDDDAMTTNTMECSSYVRGHRVSPTYCRPPRQATDTPVKAGWYEGSIDESGNRHGLGITRHDDGTEYEGPYVRDVMEGGGGKYKFITERRLIPDPNRMGSTLHRQIEKSFEGIFEKDVPRGAGMFVTKTVDCAPQVLGSDQLDIRFMEVVYDVGMYNHKNTAVGEGVRIIYSTTNGDGRSTLEKTCYRLMNGVNTNLKVCPNYASWVCQCMGITDIPVPSFSV